MSASAGESENLQRSYCKNAHDPKKWWIKPNCLENGFVYGFVATGGDAAQNIESQCKTFELQSPKRIRLREASTFTGFCNNKHDTITFAPIERNPFRDEPEQCFLVAYRAICRFMKKGNVEFFELLRQLDEDLTSAERVQMHPFHEENKAFSADMLSMAEGIKKQYDRARMHKDYSKLY